MNSAIKSKTALNFLFYEFDISCRRQNIVWTFQNIGESQTKPSNNGNNFSFVINSISFYSGGNVVYIYIYISSVDLSPNKYEQIFQNISWKTKKAFRNIPSNFCCNTNKFSISTKLTLILEFSDHSIASSSNVFTLQSILMFTCETL